MDVDGWQGGDLEEGEKKRRNIKERRIGEERKKKRVQKEASAYAGRE